MCSILGEHISLIRPARVKVHQATGAFKQAKTQGRKTHKLTNEQKQVIAQQMGFKLAGGKVTE